MWLHCYTTAILTNRKSVWLMWAVLNFLVIHSTPPTAPYLLEITLVFLMAEKLSKGIPLSTQCKNTLTSRARLCPLLKHGSVMAFRPNTLIPFMALLSVNKCENCHCLFFPRSGQKTELRWRVGRYLGQDQLYFLSLFSHKLHKTPQHWAAVVPIHLH